MYKKLIAFFLSCVVLVSISPAVAAEDAPVKPTIEEILSEHHQKAFDAQRNGEVHTAAANARQSGSDSKTLDEETVDTLNAAGYEAYNLTASSFDSLEELLNTDLDAMGLNRDSSYIIVIGGEDENNNTNPNARIPDLPHYNLDIGAGTSGFSYTYDNGVTYAMRYVTVTATDNPDYAESDSYDLHNNVGFDILNNCLNSIIYFSIDYATKKPIGSVMSLLGIELISINPNYNTELTYYCGSNWTRRWLQVYDEDSDDWITRISVEYVTQNSSIVAYYYSASLNQYTCQVSDTTTTKSYSYYYNDTDWQKEEAALATINNNFRYNYTGPVSYYYGNKLMFTHTAPYYP